MFTGLIQDIGTVLQVVSNKEGKRLLIESRRLSSRLNVNDSVSINGACQTVVEIDRDIFVVQAVHTTLQKTTFGIFRAGTKVNLEAALAVGERMGGHFVQGHINGVGTVSSIKTIGEGRLMEFRVSYDMLKYIVGEGSIAIDGVSLTVSELTRQKGLFKVSVIPHTLQKTTFMDLKIGNKANIEVDIIAKYIEQLIPKRLYGDV